MENKIEIFQSVDKGTEVLVKFDRDTVWLSQEQMAKLFEKDRTTITRHINNIFKEQELEENVVCAYFAHTTPHGAIKNKIQTKEVKFYNLDVIISVGYRVKSKRGTQFRIWATQHLKEFLIQGFSINKRRLEQKNQEIKYLKTGIRILNRAIEKASGGHTKDMLQTFSTGLSLLDDYDHQDLDNSGLTIIEAIYPGYDEYIEFITEMYSNYKSNIFAKPKDDSFKSSIGQIKQYFNGKELYPTMEEKAATLLYLIVKNHSFIDGNKRIGAACFLYFLDSNKMLRNEDGSLIISNEALASLTLFIANSKSNEADIVKKLIVSILNRNLKQ